MTLEASKYTWILDPGHGGLGPGGEYLTPGKRSPEVPPGIFEGAFNREICKRVVKLVPGVTTTITNPGPVDAGLGRRAKYVNALQAVRGNCVLLSIHANAMGRTRWHRAHGATVFFHPRNPKGKALAKWALDEIGHHTEVDITRGVKSARFTILSKTRAIPGALVECGFMTHPAEAQYLASADGQFEIAFAISQLIANCEKGALL